MYSIPKSHPTRKQPSSKLLLRRLTHTHSVYPFLILKKATAPSLLSFCPNAYTPTLSPHAHE
ncbi:MAG: hypothetical protein IKT96_00390, partial [Paludibacteraceae bacterium]|nr:hypothetical protein [Paludibacteraceae bacterium]